MKTFEELILTSGDVAAIKKEVFIDAVRAEAEPRRVFKNLVTVSPRREPRIKVPIYQPITATKVTTEGTLPAETEVTYSTVEITAEEYGVYKRFSRRVQAETDVDVVRLAIEEAGIALANAENQMIADKLEAVTNTVTPETAGTLKMKDILQGIVDVAGRKERATTVVVTPKGLTDLLKDAEFREATTFLQPAPPVITGQIGLVAGLNLFVDDQLDSTKALVMDGKRAGVELIFEDITAEKEIEINRVLKYYFYMSAGFEVINSNAVAVITPV